MTKSIRIGLFLFFIWNSYVSVLGQVSVPYYQSFDSVSVTGWTHYATSGIDDWEYATASKTILVGSRSGTKCAVTKSVGNYSTNSTMYLETPAFDLTSVTTGIHLTIWHRHYSGFATTVGVEYSIDGGSSWLVLNESGAMKYDWTMPSIGILSWRKASHCLDFLIGYAVKFRFVMATSSSPGEGWAIDDFEIDYDKFDLKALNQGGIITDICKYTSQISVSPIVFRDYTYATAPLYGTVAYYLSSDMLLDAGDTLYYTGTYNELTNAIPLPEIPHSGYWCILYQLDNANIVAETDEANNMGYVRIKVDSMYYNKLIDFETDSLPFIQSVYPIVLGTDTVFNGWLMKETHLVNDQYVFRGNKSAINKLFGQGGAGSWSGAIAHRYLISPFYDFSSETTETMICTWAKKQNMLVTSGGLDATINLQVSDLNYAPYFSNYTGTGMVSIALNTDTWSCGCTTIPASALIKFKKIRYNFSTTNYGFDWNSFFSTDDLYIGSSANDLIIPEKRELFTTTNETMFNYTYNLWNAGVKGLASTNTKFYWSTDTILDVGDVYLGVKIEWPFTTSSNATSRTETFAFTKPTLAEGTYYVFAIVDADSLETEYNENNNLSYFTLHQHDVVIPPYSNDFETNTDNWYTGATLELNNISYGNSPVVPVLDSFANTKLFYAFPASTDSMSRMEIYTPTFDLTGMLKPTLEFDLAKALNGSYSYFEPHVNISYSIDDGYTWILLDTSSMSFKGMYYKMDYTPINGMDYFYYIYHSGSQLYSLDEKNIAGNSFYQSRECRENVHHVLEITPLTAYDKIKFRFNIGFDENPTYTPVLLDNFKIVEAGVNLEVVDKKKFYVTTIDSIYKIDFRIDNTGNHIADATSFKFYISADSVLDVNDSLLYQAPLSAIRPNMNAYLNFKVLVGQIFPKGYFIYVLDDMNLVTEINEIDNIGSFKIIQNGIIPPYVNDFSNPLYEGWHPYAWDNIVSKNHVNTFRFRNRVAPAQYKYATLVKSDEFFTDWYEKFGSPSPSTYPVFFLESPPFDFAPLTGIEMTFKLLCVGSYGSFISQGGTLEMSTDGGVNWSTITDVEGDAYNWYNPMLTLSTLNDIPGWYTAGTYDFTTTTFDSVRINLSHLNGLSNVRFRFSFCANYNPSGSGTVYGMRIDDFAINTIPFTSTGDILSKEITRMYYNNGVVYIDTKDLAQQASYKLFNSTGHMVQYGDLVIDGTIKQISIHNKLSNGIYLLELMHKNHSQTLKFYFNP